MIVTARLSERLLRRLDELAAARGTTRSACLRAIIGEAALSPEERAALPDETELLELLAERARAGNVSAIKALLERQEPQGERSVAEVLAGLGARAN